MNNDILFTIAIALLTINSIAVAYRVRMGDPCPAFALNTLLATVAFVSLASSGLVFAGVYAMFAGYVMIWAHEWQKYAQRAAQPAVAGLLTAKRPQLPMFDYRPNWTVMEVQPC